MFVACLYYWTRNWSPNAANLVAVAVAVVAVAVAVSRLPPPPPLYSKQRDADNDVMMRARAQSMYGMVSDNVIKHVHRACMASSSTCLPYVWYSNEGCTISFNVFIWKF